MRNKEGIERPGPLMNLPSATFYKKIIILASVVFFIFSTQVIALDRHFAGSSPACPICQSKSSLTGMENSVVPKFHPWIAYYEFTEYPFVLASPVLFTSNNKAPPELI